MSSENQNQISSNQNVDPKRPSVESKEEDKPKLKAKILDFEVDRISLREDHFGVYFDETGKQHLIKKFTWKNKNKIEVQVINYGARVISIKLPDRKGEIEDVILGFDDLAGYLFYEKFYFGSVIGRLSNTVKNSTFIIDDQKYNINANDGKHHSDGGKKGLDKAIWDTYIVNKKVIMSHLSPHNTEGYPGDLLVQVAFELSAKNEFKININAQATRPTCVDISHLLYFNLAGHYKGPDEIYRHILTMNCNCFTPTINKIPTGEILNVIHTQYDFQIPKTLGKVMGIVPKDGFDQNLCVNRGMYQNECFVGRILHPPSGRMLEIYSNQPGVQLKTANNFGYGNILSMEEIIRNQSKCKEVESESDPFDKNMRLFEKIHQKVVDILKLDKEQNYEEIKQLISKFSKLKNMTESSATKFLEADFKVTQIQYEYLTKAREVICDNEETDNECVDLKEAISSVLKVVKVEEPLVKKSPKSSKSSLIKTSSQLNTSSSEVKRLSVKQSNASHANGTNIRNNSYISTQKSNSQNIKSINNIPSYYRDSDQIRGKGRALYKMHGGIALQTQNYPNSVNVPQFPNATLNPGEVYRHDIVYRFWIRAGNPNKWIKRNLNETQQRNNKI